MYLDSAETQVQTQDWTHRFANWSESGVLLGNKGDIMTNAIIISGYAKNSDRLRAVFAENKEPINAYLNEIDTPKIIAAILREQVDNFSEKANSNIHILAGVAIGIGVLGYVMGGR